MLTTQAYPQTNQMYQQPNLNWPVDRLLLQPINYLNSNYYLPTPNNIAPLFGLDPGATMPFIAKFAATKMGIRATGREHNGQVNPLLVYVYNQCCANNWQNNEFLFIVEYSYYATATYMKKSGSSFENAVNDAVQNVLSMYSAITLSQVPALRSMLPSVVMNDAQRQIEIFNNFQNEVRQNYQQQNMGYSNPGMMQQQQMPMGNMGGSGGGWVNVNQPMGVFNTHPGNQTQVQPQTIVHGGGVFNNNQQPAAQQTGITPEVETGRFGYIRNAAEQAKQDRVKQQGLVQAGHRPSDDNKGQVISAHYNNYEQAQRIPQPSQQMQPVQTHANSQEYIANADFTTVLDSYEWAPTEQLPYPPAINASKEVRVRITRRYPNHKPKVQFEVASAEAFKISEEQMDRNRHYVSPASKRLDEIEPVRKPVVVDYNSETDETTYSTAPASQVKTEIIGSKVKVLPTGTLSSGSSIENVVDASKYFFKAHACLDRSAQAARINTSINKEFFTKEDHNEWLVKLSQCKTIGQLSKEMLKVVTSTDSSEDLLKFVSRIDTYLRRKIIHTLRYKLGISNISIDSFMEDAPNLFAYLRDNHGESYTVALAGYQQEFIESYMAPSGYITYEESEAEGGEDHQNTRVYGVEQQVSVTYVDMKADDLNVSLINGMPNIVSAASLPQLYDFIRITTGIFSESEDHPTAHYLVTNDDRVFEIAIGLMGIKEMPSMLIHEIMI